MIETAITSEGLARLEAELEQLKTAGRAQIAERIRAASMAEANAVESIDFQDAREDQAMLERRIALLEHRVANATVVEPNGRNGIVDVGERVHLRDLETEERVEYDLVGSFEADPLSHRISALSPLGRALLGRRRGDLVTVNAPRGRLRFEILSIRSRKRPRISAA
jgi:transcription elongation factor GreA